MKCRLFIFVALSSLLTSVARAQVDAHWTSPISGDWSDASNWSSDPLAPISPGDSATLSATGSPHTATISTPVAVNQINIDSPDASLLLQGGTLTATNGIFANQGPLLIESGRISGTRIEGDAGVRVSYNRSSSITKFTLKDATLATDLVAIPESNVSNSILEITFLGTVELDGGEILLYGDSRIRDIDGVTLAGQGTLTSAGDMEWSYISPLQGGDSWTLRAIESGRIFFGTPGFTNNGVLEADGGLIQSHPSASVVTTDGVLRAINGGRIELHRLSGPVGPIEWGSEASVLLGNNALLTLPVTVPSTSTFALNSTDWHSETSVNVQAGGTLQVRAVPEVTGTWHLEPGSSFEVIGNFPYQRLTDYGVNAAIRIGFAEGVFSFNPPGALSLNNDEVDLAAISPLWDFSRGSITDGTINGMPNGGMFANPGGSFRFENVTIDTPLQVTDGQLVLDSSVIAKPLSVSGGQLVVPADWNNLAGVSVDGGDLIFSNGPTELGNIQLIAGRVQLPSFPVMPTSINVTGGTMAFSGVDLELHQILDQPWAFEAIELVNDSTIDLQENTLNFSTSDWELHLNNSLIRNGTLIKNSTDGPLEFSASELRDITIQADIAADRVVHLQGDVTVQGARLSGEYYVPHSPTTNLVLDEVEVNGAMSFGLHYGTSPTITVRNGLTLNGLMELNTRILLFEGTQSINGTGEMQTDGSRGSPGGGIEVTTGSLSIGPDFTFRSRRNGSRIIVAGPTFTNAGTLIADLDDYSERNQDVPEPGLTITVGGSISSGHIFHQNGTVKVVDGYEIRVEALEIRNAGEIELRGGSLTGSGVELINTGEFRGRGLFVSTGDGLFKNQGLLAIGDLEAFGEDSAAELGLLQLASNFQQTETGTMAFDLGGASAGLESDQLNIFGSATLAGALEISLMEGFSPVLGQPYQFITATGGILGTYDKVAIVNTDLMLDWHLAYEPTGVSISFDFLPGDLSADGAINGSDFLAWQRGESHDPLSAADLAAWQSDYRAGASPNGASQAVPEPTSFLLILLGILSWEQGRSKQTHASPSPTCNVR